MDRLDRVSRSLVKQKAGDRGITTEDMEKSQNTVNDDTTKALVWPVATYGCESWTLRKNEETRLDAFEMKGLRKILRISWTAKEINEWVLNKDGVNRELLDTVKARKLACNGHTTRKQESCLEKEILQGTMPGARRRGRARTARMDSTDSPDCLPILLSISVFSLYSPCSPLLVFRAVD